MTLARSTLFVAAALAASATVPAAVGAKLPRGAHYAGKTAAGKDVTLRLSRDSRRVARLRIDYGLTCGDDAEEHGHTYTVVRNARLRGKRHTFRAAGSYTGTKDKSSNKFELTGRVSPSGARGTFSLVNKASGDDGLRCTSGKLHWHASRVR